MSKHNHIDAPGVGKSSDYCHITSEFPLRLEDHETADMSTEAHSQFVPSEKEPIRLHHQLAGIRGK